VPTDYVPEVTAYKIYSETMSTLAWLDGHVREGKLLNEALNFCRFVLWCGVIDLCNFHATHESPLKVSGANLHTRAKQLQSDVQDRFRKNNLRPEIEMSELEKLNRKLDLIAGRLSHISPPKQETELSGVPVFRVISGGAT
jgi:hypothetical protein